MDDIDLEEMLDGVGEVICPWDGSIMESASSEEHGSTVNWAATWSCPTCGAVTTGPRVVDHAV